MSDDQLALYLKGGMLVCAVMALVSGLRFRSRGVSALFLGSGFLAMGLLLLGLLRKWPQTWLIVVGVVLVAALAGDFIARSVKAEEERR